jgi:hypothetical protein
MLAAALNKSKKRKGFFFFDLSKTILHSLRHIGHMSGALCDLDGL